MSPNDAGRSDFFGVASLGLPKKTSNKAGIRRGMVSVGNFQFGIETRSALDKSKWSVLTASSRTIRLPLIPRDDRLELLKCSAGVSLGIVSRSMAGGTHAPQ